MSDGTIQFNAPYALLPERRLLTGGVAGRVFLDSYRRALEWGQTAQITHVEVTPKQFAEYFASLSIEERQQQFPGITASELRKQTPFIPLPLDMTPDENRELAYSYEPISFVLAAGRPATEYHLPDGTLARNDDPEVHFVKVEALPGAQIGYRAQCTCNYASQTYEDRRGNSFGRLCVHQTAAVAMVDPEWTISVLKQIKAAQAQMTQRAQFLSSNPVAVFRLKSID